MASSNHLPITETRQKSVKKQSSSRAPRHGVPDSELTPQLGSQAFPISYRGNDGEPDSEADQSALRDG